MVKKIIIGGLEAEVVSTAKANLADYLICAPLGPSRFKDNLFGVCSQCGKAIMFRPYVPTKPPKICISCGLTLRPKGSA